MSNLTPRRVWIRGEFKTWGGAREAGTSAGTTLEAEFEIPDGVEGRALNRMILEEKEQLDKLALTAEYLRGSFNSQEFNERRGILTERYAKLFDREIQG